MLLLPYDTGEARERNVEDRHMNFKRPSATAAAVAMIAALAGFAANPAEALQKPNIVMLMTDDRCLWST